MARSRPGVSGPSWRHHHLRPALPLRRALATAGRNFSIHFSLPCAAPLDLDRQAF